MICNWMGCKHYKDPCAVYGYPGMKQRIRLGYCPMIDKYFDPVRQEAYYKEKHPNIRVRAGQQKQRKR